VLPAGDTVTYYLQEVVASGYQTAQGLDSIITIPTTLFSIYLAVAGFLLFRFLVRVFSIVKIISRSTKSQLKGYSILRSTRIKQTGTFLGYVLWKDPSDLTRAEEQIVLEHEMAHVKQLHTIDILLSEIAGIILWFNPIVLLIKKQIKRNHEYLADHSIAEDNRSEYVSLMAKQALIENGLLLTSSFSDNQILNRIQMLNARQTWSSGTRYLLAVPLALLLFLTFSCEENAPAVKEESQLTTEFEKVPEVDQEIDGEIFTVVESAPTPKEGMTEFYQYITSNLKYPEEARKNGIEGKVFVEFIVTKEGKVINSKVLKGIHPQCDEAARQVVANSGDWTPGTQRDREVNVRVVLPISFKLNN
jgi:TonB family protein